MMIHVINSNKYVTAKLFVSNQLEWSLLQIRENFTTQYLEGYLFQKTINTTKVTIPITSFCFSKNLY